MQGGHKLNAAYNADNVLAEGGLVVQINGRKVEAVPQEGEVAIRFFARVAKANGLNNFDMESDESWDEKDLAKELQGTYNIVKVDKPGA
jgi:hypothetical protein